MDLSEQQLILVGGPPASGKTSVGNSLVDALSPSGTMCRHLSVGDHLRAIADGREMSAFQGALNSHRASLSATRPIPSELTASIIAEWLERPFAIDEPAPRFVVLSGYPRYRDQVNDCLGLLSLVRGFAVVSSFATQRSLSGAFIGAALV